MAMTTPGLPGAKQMLCALVLSMTLLGRVSAEEPAKLDGFANLAFGSSIEQAKAAMDARGATFDPKKSTGAHLEFGYGTFANAPAAHWHLYFTEGKFYKGSVRINSAANHHLPDYEALKKTLSEKYGKPSYETKFDVNPDELYKLIQSGKVTLESVWKVGPSYSISCTLVRASSTGNTVTTRLTYQDDAMAAQASLNEKDDI